MLLGFWRTAGSTFTWLKTSHWRLSEGKYINGHSHETSIYVFVNVYVHTWPQASLQGENSAAWWQQEGSADRSIKLESVRASSSVFGSPRATALT